MNAFRADYSWAMGAKKNAELRTVERLIACPIQKVRKVYETLLVRFGGIQTFHFPVVSCEPVAVGHAGAFEVLS